MYLKAAPLHYNELLLLEEKMKAILKIYWRDQICHKIVRKCLI